MSRVHPRQSPIPIPRKLNPRRAKTYIDLRPAICHATGSFSAISSPARIVLQSLIPPSSKPRLRLPLPLFDSPESTAPNSPTTTTTAVATPTDKHSPKSVSPTLPPAFLVDHHQSRKRKLDESSSVVSFHAVSARLEQHSKLCTQPVVCATCKKVGVNFPRCAKCGDMWCSRQCRLSGGQRRHTCKTFSRRPTLSTTSTT